MNRPLFWVALALTTGILAAVLMVIPTWQWYVGLAAALGCAFACGCVRALPRATALAFLPFLFLGGILTAFSMNSRGTPELRDRLSKAGSEDLRIKGRAASVPLAQENIRILPFELENLELKADDGDWQPVAGKLWALWYSPNRSLHEGDRVEAEWRLAETEKYRNLGPRYFSRSLLIRGIDTAVECSGPELKTVGKPRLSSWRRFVVFLRQKIFDTFRATMWQPADAFMSALVLGEQAGFGKQSEQAFLKTGTLHLLSVSGLHVGLVYLLVRFATRGLLLSPALRTCFYLAVLALYTIVSGARPPSMRAFLMISMFLLAGLFCREPDALNSAWMAWIVLLVANPLLLFSPSFQLSFAAVLSLFYLEPRMETSFFQRLPYRLRSPLSAVTAIQVGMWPLTAYYFNLFSPISFLANVVVLALAAPILGVGFLTGATGLLSIHLAKPFGAAGSLLTELLIRTVDFFSALPLAFVRLATPSLLSILVYYAGLTLLLNKTRLRQYKSACVIVGCFFVVSSFFFRVRVPEAGQLKVVFLDVGQGDATFVRFPHGETLLVDGGPGREGWNAGERIVAPYLWQNGVETLNAVVATHPDNDHCGGLPFILENFTVNTFFHPGVGMDDKDFTAMARVLDEKNIPQETLRAGDRILGAKDVEVRVLNPSVAELSDNPQDFNNASVVLQLIHGDVKILLTGDIASEAEARLVADEPGLASQIVKAPHHGSAGSSTKPFIEAVRPELVIFSAGRRSAFRHPVSSIVERYRSIGCEVASTAEIGAVTVTSNGTSWRFRGALNLNAEPVSVGEERSRVLMDLWGEL